MALKWLRDNLRHLKFILWGVVAVFVLLVFVDWGAGRSSGGASGEAAVQVGDRVVDEREFIDQLRRNQERFRQLYGDNWEQVRANLDLAALTVNDFIGRELQLQEARRAGLRVSERELREEILKHPAFQREGGGFVGAEAYERRVRAYFQMSPGEFEQRFAEDLLVTKLGAMLEHGVYVSEAEVDDTVRRERETADFDAILLRYERYLSDVTVSDEEARAFYDMHKQGYERPEQRVIRSLVVETSRLRRLLPVSDEELKTYYDEHQSEFMQEEQARARHVLIRVPPGASEEERTDARIHADGVAKIARAGGDFAALAAKHSEDPGSKDKGGDLGWFGRGRMVKEFEDAVFSAKPGDIVGPVESQFGYHVIKVEGFQPQRQQPFEEVKEQVRFKVLEGRAAAEAEVRASALAKRLTAAPPATDEAWQAIADEDEAVVLNVSPPFGADGPVPGTGEGAELAAEVFAASQGDIGGPRAIPRGWMVWQLTAVEPAGVPPFEGVQTEVEQAVRRDKALAMAAERGATLAAAWRDGADPAELAKDAKTTVVEGRDHRRDSALASIGGAPALDQLVFGATSGEVVGPVQIGDRGVVVAKVAAVNLLDDAELASAREAIRQRLVSERAELLLRSILNERRRETTVTVNNQLMERFAPRT